MSSTAGTALFLFVRLFFPARLEGASDEIRGFFALISATERSPPRSREWVLFLLSGVAPEDMIVERKSMSHDHVGVTTA